MNYLILLRHGKSQWNLENRFTGFHDVPLTADGEAEAQKAGEAIAKAGIKIDQVYTSTQSRAMKTAEIALKAAGQNLPYTAHDDLRERDYGDLTGLNKDETRAKYGEAQVHIWRRSYDVPPPGGESLKDVLEKRVKPYFTREIWPLLQAGKNVLVAAHGNSLRATLIALNQRTPEDINDFEIPTGSPLIFEMENGQIQRFYFL